MILALTLVAVAATAAPSPLGIRAEVAPLGRGTLGTVVGVAVQVAPEDRDRLGQRARITTTLVKGNQVLDRGSAVVEMAPDGSALLYREWPAGEVEIRVTVESLDGSLIGAWVGTVVIPALEERFEPPQEAPADALALAVRRAPADGVKFMAPKQSGGLGALQLEVSVPSSTARVTFTQDGKELFAKNRPPWTVSVSLGEVARRTSVRAVAYDAGGEVLGEDVFVLNAPANQLAVAIGVRPASDRPDAQIVTVSVSGSKPPTDVRLFVGERVVARWDACPCVVELGTDDLGGAPVLTAEATAADGTRGDAVYLVGQGGFVEQVRVDKVELPVVVLGADGAPVAGLEQGDFSVREDDVDVAVEGFGTTADLPLALGLAVDTSGSMEERWDDVKRAVAGFVSELQRSGDESFLLSFSFDARVEEPWSRDARGIEAALDRLKPEGGTSLHDAVVHALEAFRGRGGRTALVLLTDGEDTTSRTGWDAALRYAQTARVPVFPIGLRIGRLDFTFRGRLRELAGVTGGEAFFPKDAQELRAVYATISDQLRTQYLLSYVSPSAEGPEHFRIVTVEVAGEGLTARTIAGYYPAQ